MTGTDVAEPVGPPAVMTPPKGTVLEVVPVGIWAIGTVPEFISEPAIDFPVRVCALAKFTRVSVAAGMLTVTLPSAPVAACSVRRPEVALPNVTDPSVPDAPSWGGVE